MLYELKSIKQELLDEVIALNSYWKNNSIDVKYGGFIGRRDFENKVVENADKGIILNTRILWSFSALYQYLKDPELLPLMNRSFEYLYKNFKDSVHGGVFWLLNYKGNVIDPKKQIYAQAFTIYALSEYYKVTSNLTAKRWAIDIFHLIEENAFDQNYNGYIEAFDEHWQVKDDMRLSDKDVNSSKTMNTHLHILEAYTNLYRIHPVDQVKNALTNLIDLMLEKFLNDKFNFTLFFDNSWKEQSHLISYGHDIEAIWLLKEAAFTIKDQPRIEKTSKTATKVADEFLNKAYTLGMGIINESNPQKAYMDTDRHWWPQIEAIVGLFYVYKQKKDHKYLDVILDIWSYIQGSIIDKKNGEWHFRINKEGIPYKEEDKLGMWKCPYHNSRGLLILLADELSK